VDKTLKIALILTAVDKMSEVINKSVEKSQKKLNGFREKLDRFSKGMNAWGNKLMVGGAIGMEFFHTTIDAAEESEIAHRRLSRVFQSMGQDYEGATKQSEKYASALQMQIGIEDEVIMAVQAKLATFERVGNSVARSNGIYERATKATFDMQAAGFGEAAQNAVQLGKALQDPIKGITALRRSGITFTEAEQKKIKALVQSGRVFEAQKTIMKAIEKQVGGVAEATTTSAQKMKIRWTELQETIGRKLLPVFDVLVTKTATVIDRIAAFTDAHPKLVKWMGIAAGALFALGVTFKVVAGITAIFNAVLLANPIVLIVTAIIAAVALIIYYWKPISGFFRRLWSGIKAVFFTALKAILWIVAWPVMLVIKYWKQISGFFVGLWNGIVAVATSIWNAIGNAITAPIKWIQQKWQDLTDWFTKTWEKISGFFSRLWKGVKSAATDLVTAPARAVDQLTRNNAVIEVNMKRTAQTVDDYLPHSPAKKGPLKNINKVRIVETIAKSISAKPLIGALESSFGRSFNSPSNAPIAARSGGSVVLNYNPTLHYSGDNKQDFMNMLQRQSEEIRKMMAEAQRKRDRTKF
jgi:hypothetical protein